MSGVDGTCCRMMGNIWGVKVNAWTSCCNGPDSNMRASEKYTIMIRVATLVLSTVFCLASFVCVGLGGVGCVLDVWM